MYVYTFYSSRIPEAASPINAPVCPALGDSSVHLEHKAAKALGFRI